MQPEGTPRPERRDCAEARKGGAAPNQCGPIHFRPPKREPDQRPGESHAGRAGMHRPARATLRDGLCPSPWHNRPEPPEGSEGRDAGRLPAAPTAPGRTGAGRAVTGSRKGIAGTGQAATPATGQARDARHDYARGANGRRVPPCNIGRLGQKGAGRGRQQREARQPSAEPPAVRARETARGRPAP